MISKKESGCSPALQHDTWLHDNIDHTGTPLFGMYFMCSSHRTPPADVSWTAGRSLRHSTWRVVSTAACFSSSSRVQYSISTENHAQQYSILFGKERVHGSFNKAAQGSPPIVGRPGACAFSARQPLLRRGISWARQLLMLWKLFVPLAA